MGRDESPRSYLRALSSFPGRGKRGIAKGIQARNRFKVTVRSCVQQLLSDSKGNLLRLPLSQAGDSVGAPQLLLHGSGAEGLRLGDQSLEGEVLEGREHGKAELRVLFVGFLNLEHALPEFRLNSAEMSPELHQKFTGLSPEFRQNIELEHLKKEDNHNSAFPQAGRPAKMIADFYLDAESARMEKEGSERGGARFQNPFG